jgi:cytoskeleton protein RodZ
MVFTGQTWVSVTDKSGKVIFEKMAHAGDKETFNAAPPLNVVIGNASATKLDFGGRDVDLAAHTKNNVARITLE